MTIAGIPGPVRRVPKRIEDELIQMAREGALSVGDEITVLQATLTNTWVADHQEHRQYRALLRLVELARTAPGKQPAPTTAPATPAARPLITRGRAELERAVIEAARWWRWPGRLARLGVAVTDLDEWERLRAEAAG